MRVVDISRQRENLERYSRTEPIIGAAIEVHKQIGPGLLESTYEECLCHELNLRGIQFQRQLDLPVLYKGLKLDCGYRLDLLVEDRVVVELKAVEQILPVHEAQLLTYLHLAHKPVGLLINFNVPLLKDGIRRRII
ncbi:MAG TPA: GxxExxY protein [Terriglobales bacterium]|nr:GxxExxY protein [Terriglobales bacterium]